LTAWHEIVSIIGAAGRTYLQVKGRLEQSIPFDSGWLHLMAGPLIFVAAAFLLRKPLSSWWPWLVVLFFEGLNEILDLTLGSWAPREFALNATDVLLTMALPTAVLAIARGLEIRRESAEAQELRR
jgi:hypothetical protein